MLLGTPEPSSGIPSTAKYLFILINTALQLELPPLTHCRHLQESYINYYQF